MIRNRVVALALVSLIALCPSPARAHPLHTTYAELTFGPGRGTVRAMIRLFVDDFSATVIRNYPMATRTPRDFERAAYTYVAKRFRLVDPRGAGYQLGWCGLKRESNYMWVCLGSDSFSTPGPVRLADQLMHEVFEDQINLVKLSANGKSETLLFAGDDGPKKLTLF